MLHRAIPRHALAGVLLSVACVGPIPTAETPSPVASSEAPSTDAPDASHAPTAAFHSITVTLCSRDCEACQRAPSTGGGTPYRFAFGSSVGTLRTREQVIADLYRELKNRTSAGTNLAAAAHRLEAPSDGGRFDPGGTGPVTPGTDPIVDAAFQLMEAVDGQGEVTIDVAHGKLGCKLSFNLLDTDAGGRRCLIVDTSRPSPQEPEGPRGHESKFGR